MVRRVLRQEARAVDQMAAIAAPRRRATGRSDVQANRHHEVAEVVRACGAQQARAQGRAQAERELVRLHALDALHEELGVERDLERLALVWGRQALARIPDLRRL